MLLEGAVMRAASMMRAMEREAPPTWAKPVRRPGLDCLSSACNPEAQGPIAQRQKQVANRPDLCSPYKIW